MADSFLDWIMVASAKSSFSFSISPYSKSVLIIQEMILAKHLYSSDSFRELWFFDFTARR